MAAPVLVIDDDPAIRRFIDIHLRVEGMDVVAVPGNLDALEAAATVGPALVLVDLASPGLAATSFLRRLRSDHRTVATPVIVMTPRAAGVDVVLSLAEGADDHVLKPFDPLELVARVKRALQRHDELRAASPLTGLPGNARIHAEIGQRLATRTPLAVAYADLNNFKAHNDRFGFVAGDALLRTTAASLGWALDDVCGADAFLGHVGGDDFVALCGPAEAPQLCAAVINRFESERLRHYPPADLARGRTRRLDRQGTVEELPLATVAIGVATTERRTFADPREIVEVAAEMKSVAKRDRSRSCWAVDDRGEPGEGLPRRADGG